MEQLRAASITLAVAAAGGVIFEALSVPAAYLTGSATAVTIYAAFFKQKAVLPTPLRNATFAIVGVMMGAGITPDRLAELATLPVALIGLVAVIVSATMASYVVLRTIAKWDRLTSLLGSIPGHFSLVMIVSMENGAAVEKVVLAQAFRLLALLTLIPLVLGGSEAASLRVLGAEGATPLDIAITLGVAFGAIFVASRLRVPAPALMGPMLAATILSGTGLLSIAVPGWLAAPAFLVLGASVGTRFTGIRAAGLPRMLIASAASFVVAVAAAIVVSAAISWVLGVPMGEVFLAYAPGGLDAMIALTFLLGLDVAFVAVLHTARMILLGFSVPVLIPMLKRRWDADAGAVPCDPAAKAGTPPPQATA